MPAWSLYIIRCGDGTLYTGVAVDIQRRFEEHRAQGKKCARYLRGRGPLKLVFKRRVGERGKALKAEWRVKQLPREQKLRLIQGRLKWNDIFGTVPR
jgi:putative endonuclease